MSTFLWLGLLVGLFFTLGIEVGRYQLRREQQAARFERWYNANAERLIEEGVIRVD